MIIKIIITIIIIKIVKANLRILNKYEQLSIKLA